VAVVLTPVERRRFEERLVVQGSVEARNSALVTPRQKAPIEAIFVREGAPVVAGKTELFQTDSLKLRKTFEIRRAELAVAKCALREKEASLERVQVQLEKAVLDERRHKRLFERQIESTDTYETYACQLREAQALVKHGKSLVDLAAAQEQQAVHAVASAEKDLKDTLVLAPISGRVSERFQEPGEMGEVGKPVLRIDDLSLVEVSAFLPAALYPRIAEGKTRFHVRTGALDLGERTVSYRSPTIDAKLRTFEVKCVVKDPPDGAAPGAMAVARVVLRRHEALGVPLPAVQARRGGKVVFVVKDGKARMVEVTTGLETDGWVAIQGDGLAEGTPVVTMGQFLLNDGTPVDVQKGGR
jgi:RND family efflux transporter MFP subunit